MIYLDVNESVVLEHQQVLEQALSTNPKTQKALQKLINKVITEARKEMVSDARMSMDKDPRGAAWAIRRSVYKKILGANVNIYNHRKRGKPTTYEPPRRLRQGQRGGNRVPRGQRTHQMMSYGPHDRQMVLRWINEGTATRRAGTRSGQLSGNRGNIAARNWFIRSADRALQTAADNLATLIDTELEKTLNKKK